MDDHHIKALFNTLSLTKDSFNTAKLLLPGGLQGCCHCHFGFWKTELAGDQAGEQGVAQGGEGTHLVNIGLTTTGD